MPAVNCLARPSLCSSSWPTTRTPSLRLLDHASYSSDQTTASPPASRGSLSYRYWLSHTGKAALIRLAHCNYKSLLFWSPRLSSVCLSVPHQISKTKRVRREISRSPSKNMRSDFAPEVAKYPKGSPKPPKAQNTVQAYCLVPLAMQLVSCGN